MSLSLSLVLPTWNAGPEFPDILERMLDQEVAGERETIVIDSGSTDGTAEFLRKQPVRLIEIPNRLFNHGETRNLGIQQARGKIVVLATQDARPYDHRWLQGLADCFEDPHVAGAYSRQQPRPDASPFIKDRLRGWVGTQDRPRVQSICCQVGFDALPPLKRLERVTFDNVSSSVRRSIALRIRFRRHRFGEDLDWSLRAVLAGYKIVYQPRSVVIHSHNNSVWRELRRTYLDHQNLHRLLGVHTVPRWSDVWRCTKVASAQLWRAVSKDPELGARERTRWYLAAGPFALAQNLGQHLGAKSVAHLRERRRLARLMDAVLSRRI